MNDEQQTQTVHCETPGCVNVGIEYDVALTSAAMCGACGEWIVAPRDVPDDTNGGLLEPPLPGTPGPA